MKTFHYILLILVFATGLLLGVQAPGFVDQYEKRINAHYLEVNDNFKGFQDIANRFHGGNIESLIKKHDDSGDSTFRAEAEPLRRIFERKIRFERELQAMQTSLIGKVKHIALAGDRETIQETWTNYSINFPLNTSAILFGLTVALISTIAFQMLIILFSKLLVMARHVKQPA
jgi:hypothetical protein